MSTNAVLPLFLMTAVWFSEKTNGSPLGIRFTSKVEDQVRNTDAREDEESVMGIRKRRTNLDEKAE